MELTKTRSQLVNEVAYSKLRVAGTGQILEPEYEQEISNKIDPLLAQLSADEICHVGNSNAINVEWFDAIAGLLANLCATLVGKSFDPNIKEYYERTLRRMNSTRTTYETIPTEYF